ncbi:MAG: DUF4249 domain-containing protein [Chitinophagaceae bacterium]
MKKKLQILCIISLGILSLIACKKFYEPPVIKAETNFLVVDGTISCGNDAITTITLSRTKRLNDSILFEPELNALVFIEQETGASFFVPEQGNGTYQTQPLTLDPDKNYRLKIVTASNKEYVSPFITGKTTPAIDSVTWKQEEDVTISVHTHDPLNNTRYYRWEYIETWNYQSIFSTMYGVKDGLIYIKDAAGQTDSCWRTTNSTNIILSSSIALSEDVISNFPLTVIPQHDEKISKGYSILVKQYAITPEAFQYLQLIQKNTQQLGTLFDAQPSQLKGNIQSVDAPNEPVIGYISASTIAEKRIFIRNNELTDWKYLAAGLGCGTILTISQNPANHAIFDYPDPFYGPYYFVTGGIVIARKACLECTERGGTNIKPSFW